MKAEIKKIVIEEGKQVAQVVMLIPKSEALKVDMGNVEITVKASQASMFPKEETKA